MRVFSLALAILLVGMLVCPVVAAVQEGKSKPESHCSTEPPKDQEKAPAMLCCCDQDAIPVQEVHAPYCDPPMHIPAPLAIEPAHGSFGVDPDHLADQNTSDQLSRLSTLRL